jgi:predicted nucleic acid-binding protein
VKVVFDTSVVLAGVGWRGEAYQCLVMMARRRLIAFATITTVAEARAKAGELAAAGRFSHDPMPMLNWYFANVRTVDPAPLGKQRSRDVNDDPILACALGAGAKIVTAYDKDLLDLGKPFGIEILKPAELLRRLKG